MTSQIFANIYLHEFDRFVRHNLKPQAYLRYGDDFILFARTRHQARMFETIATNFLASELRLTINRKNNMIVAARQGLHMLGHVITGGCAVVDKYTTRSVLQKVNISNAASYKSLYLAPAAQKRLEYSIVDELDKILDN